MLELKNPHSILAAIKKRPQDVAEIRFATTRPTDVWQQVIDAAERNRIPMYQTTGQVRGARRNKSSGPKQERVGIATAIVKENSGVDLTTLFGGKSSQPQNGLWLALDCLQDPHNVGAIFRTAGFFGVRGIVVTKDRSAPLNATVYDVAAGGVEAVRFANVPNLSRSLELAKKQGLWLLGTSEHAQDDINQMQPDRPWLLVLGNEEKGLRRLTLEQCDVTCGIKPSGDVTSLNVSAAAAVCISHLSSGGDRS